MLGEHYKFTVIHFVEAFRTVSLELITVVHLITFNNKFIALNIYFISLVVFTIVQFYFETLHRHEIDLRTVNRLRYEQGR